MDTSYRGGGHGRVLHMPSPTLSMAGGLWNLFWAFQVALVIKNPPANARDIRDSGSIPGLRRSPGGGNSDPLQYSCLENPMDRGAWRATDHGVTKSQTRLKQLSMHAQDLFWPMSCEWDWHTVGWGISLPIQDPLQAFPLCHGH